jgi:hypothetical protein
LYFDFVLEVFMIALVCASLAIEGWDLKVSTSEGWDG